MDINIDLRDCIKFDNTYHFKLIRDGKIIQEETTHNIVCKDFFGDGYNTLDLFLGNGKGTPSYDDTSLFNIIWGKTNFTPKSQSFDSNVSDDGKEAYAANILKYSIPASSEYVGTITECGIGDYTSADSGPINELYTHALIYDAEGNPISIKKTDLDVLEIEVVFKIVAKENDILKLCPWKHNPLHQIVCEKESLKFQKAMKPRISAMLSSTLTKTGGLYCSMITSGGFNSKPGYYMKNWTDIKIKNENATFNPDTKIMTIPSCRLGTTFEDDEQLFIKGLTICNAFYIPFPNNSIFPTYTIENIDVGTGDGEQSIFTCPLGYFVNHSEQIKIDGVLQREGVDYIIEENSLGCSNLMASNESIITGGVSSNRAYNYPLFLSCKDVATHSDNDINVGNIPYGFNSAKPLFFDCLKPTRVNYFQMGKGLNLSGNFSFFGRNSEEEDWNEITSFNYNSSETSSLTFEEVNYRYYKVSTDSSSVVEYDSNANAHYVRANIQNNPSCYFKKDDLCMFGYKGRGIIFINPPTAGSVITMSADTDLPMKNNNFVLDFAITLQF